MKVCTKCNEPKPLEMYGTCRSRKGVLLTRGACKSCWQKQNTKWNINNSLRVKKRVLLQRFNVSYEVYQNLLRVQNNVCAICKKYEVASTKNDSAVRSLCVDHCHKTGTIRGLLCQTCNLGIGNLKDSIELLDSAKHYLERYL